MVHFLLFVITQTVSPNERNKRKVVIPCMSPRMISVHLAQGSISWSACVFALQPVLLAKVIRDQSVSHQSVHSAGKVQAGYVEMEKDSEMGKTEATVPAFRRFHTNTK